MPYNPEIHHRRSIRLQGYDYSAKGLYFVTICVQDKRCLLGSIDDGRQHLNELGAVADQCWREIPQHYPNVVLHEHIVMPNHVHGLIEIKNSGIAEVDGVSSGDGVQSGDGRPVVDGVPFADGVQNIEPLQQTKPTEHTQHSPEPSEFGFQDGPHRNEYQKIIPGSLGAIVRGYKIGVTKWVREHTDIDNLWQRNFHEHIVRDHNDYLRIAAYIRANPQNWKGDKFYEE